MRRTLGALVLFLGLVLILLAQGPADAGGGKKDKGAGKGKHHSERVHKALHELAEAHKALVAAVKQEQKEGQQTVAEELLRAVNEVGDAISRAHAAAGLDRKK